MFYSHLPNRVKAVIWQTYTFQKENLARFVCLKQSKNGTDSVDNINAEDTSSSF